MSGLRLRRHELGFLQIANMPTTAELQEYYASVDFQEEKSSYRHTYSSLETNVRKLQHSRLVEKALSLRETDSPGGGFLKSVVAKVFCWLEWPVEGGK